MSPGRLFSLPSDPTARRLTIGLSGATFLLWLGGSAMLPLLPAYLREKGATPGIVGLIMSAYFAASVLTQYPIGRLSDRLGRRPVMLVGFVLFAIGSIGFAATTGALFAIVFRGLQGIGAGAVTVASGATIGTEVAPHERGAAYGALFGSQTLALAVGPLAGSILGASSVRLLFVIAAGAAFAASVPVLAVVPGGRASLPATRAPIDATTIDQGGIDLLTGSMPTAGRSRRFRIGLPITPPVVGVLLIFVATGLIIGVYDSSWTLLLRLRGASDLAIGLSWTLYTLPFALLSVPAGRIAERVDRRLLAVGALCSSAVFASLYPFLHSVSLLVGIGCVEAVGAVFASPTAMLVLARAVPMSAIGEAQGLVETARTGAVALAAACSGALFGIDPIIPFVAAALLLVGAAGAIARVWRVIEQPHGSIAGMSVNGARDEPRPKLEPHEQE